MASSRFRALEREIGSLRRDLLPDPFDPLGMYPPRVQIRTRAFLLLAHAAIESHLEEEAKRLARKAETCWLQSKRITRPLAVLLASSMSPFGVPSSGGDRSTEKLIEDTARNAFQTHFRTIKNNHGLKERNVMALYGPLGIESAMFGSLLLPSLDSFGEDRGVHAHAGATLVQHLDPQTEHDRVVQLLQELEAFDASLRRYARGIR